VAVLREALGLRAVIVVLLQLGAWAVAGAVLKAVTHLPTASLVLLCFGAFCIVAAVSLLWLYRHPDSMRFGHQRDGERGTRPSAPTAPRRDPEPALAPSSDEASDAVWAALERELAAGRALAGAVGPSAPIVLWPQPPSVAVGDWEKRVVHLLNKAERWELADYFLATIIKRKL
jgi:hypothetical protein